MVDNFYVLLGQQIRAYRKVCNMTLEQVAFAINKSLATVSKYEKGEVSVDAATLCEISDVLGISPSQLLNRPSTVPKPAGEPLINPFFKQSLMYLYWYNGTKKTICCGVLEIDYTENKATLYLDVINPKDYLRCKHIAYGDIVSFDAFTRFMLKNINSEIDILIMSFSNLAFHQSYTIGQIFGMTYSYQNVCLKALISNKVMSDKCELETLLKLSKEELKQIKASNFFTLI